MKTLSHCILKIKATYTYLNRVIIKQLVVILLCISAKGNTFLFFHFVSNLREIWNEAYLKTVQGLLKFQITTRYHLWFNDGTWNISTNINLKIKVYPVKSGKNIAITFSVCNFLNFRIPPIVLNAYIVCDLIFGAGKHHFTFLFLFYWLFQTCKPEVIVHLLRVYV